MVFLTTDELHLNMQINTHFLPINAHNKFKEISLVRKALHKFNLDKIRKSALLFSCSDDWNKRKRPGEESSADNRTSHVVF